MKKKIFSLLVLLAAAVSGAWADELTVHDGSATNGYVPVYGFYADAYLKCQTVYPATELAAMAGSSITSLTYYATSPAQEAWTGTFQVHVVEVADATISSFNDLSSATLVYEGTLDGTQSTMTIPFTTPYNYQGGNLLVSVFLTTTGNYKSITWGGETVNGASVQGYSYSSLNDVSATQRNFLPKTTFTYEASGGLALTKEAEAEAHGDIQFNVGEGENVKEDVTSAKEGDLVTVVITPDEGWVVNEVSGLWYANEAAARGLRRIAASPESLDMLKDFDLQFVSEDPETRAQTYTFEMKRAKAEISVSYKKLLNNADITIENIADQTYTGQAIEPTITVKDGSTVLVKGTDYDVVYFDNVNAAPSTDENAPAVVITAVEGSEKYAGGNSKTFTINPAQLSDEMIAEIADQTYTTNPIKPALTITFGEGENEQTLVKGTDFTVVYSNNTVVGVGTATVTGQGNFTGTASADFNIVSKALNKNMISPIDDADYTGEPYEPELDVNFNGKKLQEGVDYTVEYTDNVEAGKATATITGMGNYTGEASANFYVGRVDLNDDTRIKIAYIYWEDYDGQKHTPRVEVRDGMKPLVLDVDYKMTFKNNVEAGTARITFQGLGNYKGKVNKYFAIKSYVLDIDMVQDIADQTWTGEAVTPAISVINGNVTLTQDKDFTVKFKNNVNEGTATAIINGTGNFRSIDLVKTFKIVKKAEVTEPEAVDSPGEATAISGPAAAGSPAGTAYDLGGRKAKANRKGVVIIDGKLVLKK